MRQRPLLTVENQRRATWDGTAGATVAVPELRWDLELALLADAVGMRRIKGSAGPRKQRKRCDTHHMSSRPCSQPWMTCPDPTVSRRAGVSWLVERQSITLGTLTGKVLLKRECETELLSDMEECDPDEDSTHKWTATD